MALLTHAQEYQALREAIQVFSTGRKTATVTVDGISVTYVVGQMEFMQSRERELAQRLTCRNVRKRTIPEFS